MTKKYSFSLESYQKYYINKTTANTKFQMQKWWGNEEISFVDQGSMDDIQKNSNVSENTKQKIKKWLEIKDNFVWNSYNQEKKYLYKKQLSDLGYTYLFFNTEMDLEEIAQRENKLELLNDFKNENIFLFLKYKSIINDKFRYRYAIKIKNNRKILDINNLENYITVKNIQTDFNSNTKDILDKKENLKLKINNQLIEKRKEIAENYSFYLKQFNEVFKKLISNINEISDYDTGNIESTTKFFLKESIKFDDVFYKIKTKEQFEIQKDDLIEILTQASENVTSWFEKSLNKDKNNIYVYEQYKKTKNEFSNVIKKIKQYEQEYLTFEQEYLKIQKELNEIKELKNSVNDNTEGYQKMTIEFDLEKIKKDSGYDWDQFQLDIAKEIDEYNKQHPNDIPLDDRSWFNQNTKQIVANDLFFEKIFSCTKNEGLAKLNEILKTKYNNIYNITGTNWKDEILVNKVDDYEYFGFGNVLNNKLETIHTFNVPTIMFNHPINFFNFDSEWNVLNNINENSNKEYFKYWGDIRNFQEYISLKQMFEFNFDNKILENLNVGDVEKIVIPREKTILNPKKQQILKLFQTNNLSEYKYFNSNGELKNFGSLGNKFEQYDNESNDDDEIIDINNIEKNIKVNHFYKFYHYCNKFEKMQKYFENSNNNGNGPNFSSHSRLDSKTIIVICSVIGGIILLSLIIGISVSKKKKRHSRW